jgi:hypothetical protein
VFRRLREMLLRPVRHTWPMPTANSPLREGLEPRARIAQSRATRQSKGRPAQPPS